MILFWIIPITNLFGIQLGSALLTAVSLSYLLSYQLSVENITLRLSKNSSLTPDSPFRLKPNERATVIIKERFIIVDDTESRQAQRYSIAHELGHLLLGNTNEPMAERFAISLLAPACVLWGCGIRTAQDIASVCDISITAARIREARMGVLYERNKFLTSPLERKVYKNFETFVEKYKRNKR